MRRQVLGLLCLVVALQILTVVSFAEQLPVKTYTTGEGLPRDEVTLVRRDSRGFIWLAAGDGISRFDGYKFRNYTTDDGLADRRVNDLLETRSGVYWMATAAGLCRFNPTGLSKLGRKSRTTTKHDESDSTIEPMFVTYNPTEKPIAFNVLREDETGAIWCGTRFKPLYFKCNVVSCMAQCSVPKLNPCPRSHQTKLNILAFGR
jgi:ligand-binding sensor domain-containing protein